MKINVGELNFGGVERYCADGAIEIIKAEMAKDPKSINELVRLIEAHQSDKHTPGELRYIKHLAANALARARISDK
ncbi:hypothetical protein [Pseudomonas sp. PA27(2017)]|uniref:hypothetical protein n=1 Tax=Pseudomonas sp. PA27(2017) TaxID=1932112 RepID=UPI000962DC98|nr:hypothetical protein [Pseudomonas sp. PA27(2017)]OLU34915.1 hypothetical protein BVH06_04655 [Pseudomonas sp. PA27(2017)]